MNNKIHTSRSAVRYQTNEPARIEVLGKHETIFCRMSNLSSTGAFFEIISSNFIPKKGDPIRITITLKQLNTSHVIKGEIIWKKGAGMGVMFIK